MAILNSVAAPPACAIDSHKIPVTPAKESTLVTLFQPNNNLSLVEAILLVYVPSVEYAPVIAAISPPLVNVVPDKE